MSTETKIEGRALLGGPARFIPLQDGERVGSLLEQIDACEQQIIQIRTAASQSMPAGLNDDQMMERRRDLLLQSHKAELRLERLQKELESEQGVMLRLRYDWGALAEYEAEFQPSGNEDLPFDIASLLPGQKKGNLNNMARWAYAMTATDREDRELVISWRDFRRRIPIDTKVAFAWQTNVTALFLQQKNSDGEAGATSSVAGSASPKDESSGSPSTGSAPRSSNEPIEGSGE